MAKFVEIATIQFPSEWARGRADAQRIVLDDLAASLASLQGLKVDLVVVSEGVGAVGQTMAEAETTAAPGPFLTAYRDLARQARCHVAGAVKLAEGNAVYNAVVYYGPDGEPVGAYRKTYPTEGELREGIVPGPGAVILETAIGRLGTAICFDLNFEDLRDAYRAQRPDILVFASLFHGGLAQAIWAYECRAFLACAWQYPGGGILDPFGRPLAVNDCYHPVARATVNLDRVLVHLDGNREKFPAIERRYGPAVRIDVPADIGTAMIYSQADRLTAQDVAREFDLEPLDAYLDRSRRARDAKAPMPAA